MHVVERVLLVRPRGFCAGVTRAVAVVERALAIFPPPIYVRRAIVHNRHVVDRLAAKGAVFVNELDDVPVGSVVVLSAHGVAGSVRVQAVRRNLRVIDATCPLVAKVHSEVRRFSRLGADIILIGQRGHDEVVGTMGQGPRVQLVERVSDVSGLHVTRPDRVACITQTTLSPSVTSPIIDRLRLRFPHLMQPAAPDICYATRNRQAAVAWLARLVDVVLVVGDQTSSNSRHLRETAASCGVPAYLVGSAADLNDEWFDRARAVGVSAGASTPENDVSGVVKYLCRGDAVLDEETFIPEHASFALPRGIAL